MSENEKRRAKKTDNVSNTLLSRRHTAGIYVETFHDTHFRRLHKNTWWKDTRGGAGTVSTLLNYFNRDGCYYALHNFDTIATPTN